MDIYSSYAWLIAAGILVTVEIATGTFYLLMLAIAALITWLIERMGGSFMLQSSVFLISSIVLCYAVHRYRHQRQAHETINVASDLDAGESVQVTWRNGVGSAFYRGTNWQVVLQSPVAEPADGTYHIIRLDGNRLLVRPV
ncbi:MAG: NfeD family protein [Formosimonas sp.]